MTEMYFGTTGRNGTPSGTSIGRRRKDKIMTDLADDVDPTTATSWDEFAFCMRRLRARADNVSYRELERWGEEHGRPLARTTLLEVLHGRRIPRKGLLLAFVEACGVDPTLDPRWEQTWNRLNEQLNVTASSVSNGQGADGEEDSDTVDYLDEPVVVSAGVWDQAQYLIQQARLSAEREAATIVARAREEAKSIVRQARTEATEMQAAAHRDAEQIIQAARERARQETEALRESVLQELIAELDKHEPRRPATPRPAEGVTDRHQPGVVATPGKHKRRFGR